MSTLLGFDFGPRKIGVAVGQTITGSASALTTIRSRREKPDWSRIEQLVREWQPNGAVVGLPFNMDDTETEARAERKALHASFRAASDSTCIWSTSVSHPWTRAVNWAGARLPRRPSTPWPQN